MKEPIPTVESFLHILLEEWNGDDYRNEILDLLSHLSLQPFDGKKYSGTSDNGHFEEWTTSLQWTNCFPSAYYISTPKEGTTSEQWTKCSSPMHPLFGGSTVLCTCTVSWPYSSMATIQLFCSSDFKKSFLDPIKKHFVSKDKDLKVWMLQK